jgi:hypothetical protein
VKPKSRPRRGVCTTTARQSKRSGPERDLPPPCHRPKRRETALPRGISPHLRVPGPEPTPFRALPAARVPPVAGGSGARGQPASGEGQKPRGRLARGHHPLLAQGALPNWRAFGFNPYAWASRHPPPPSPRSCPVLTPAPLQKARPLGGALGLDAVTQVGDCR